MAKVDKSKFNNLTTGIQFPNKLIITGGDDTGRAINANQIEWGTSEFLGSALTEGTTEEVLTRIENTQTTYENVWEDYAGEPGPTIEMVDLGLPSGTLWAKCNLGAQTETDYGNYYQWAATTPLHVEGTTVNPSADWTLCPYTDDGTTFEKYDGTDYDTLQSEDDAVTVILGTGYRMPTQDDFQELIDETDNEWANIDGVNGWKFMKTDDHDIYIFLPAAGNCDESNFGNVNKYGGYWSSDLDVESPDDACYLIFSNKNGIDIDIDYRYGGRTIRPVRSANS